MVSISDFNVAHIKFNVSTNRFPTEENMENMYLLFNSGILKLLLRTNCGGGGRSGRERNRGPNFLNFCSLDCFNCWWVGKGGVKQKILFRTGWNCIFCVPGFIQGWGTQGDSKISSFCFWCLSRERGGVVNSRVFSCDPTDEEILVRLSESCWKLRICFGSGVSAWNLQL